MSKKRFGFLLTFVLLASLLLAACANTNSNEGSGTGNGLETQVPVTGNETPGLPTELPTAADQGLAQTPLATEPALIETPVVTETPLMQETPTTMATPLMTETVAETPAGAAGQPQANNQQCDPNRMSSLLNYAAMTNDGQLVGDVTGLVVLHAAKDAYNVDPNLFNSDGTLSNNDSNATIAMPTNAPAPVIGYVIVAVDDNAVNTFGFAQTGDLLVPFSGVQPISSNAATSMGNNAADTESAAEDNNASDESESTDNAVLGNNNCALTFNLSSADLANAPIVDTNNLDFTTAGWNNDINTWGEGLGFTAPTLGNNVSTNYVVFEDGVFDSVDIDVRNLNDESLGEIEDFIVNPQDGSLTYAILKTDSFLGLGGREVPVPVDHFLWVHTDNNDPKSLGEIIIPVQEGTFDNAPQFDLNNTDFTNNNWEADWVNFWNGLNTQ